MSSDLDAITSEHLDDLESRTIFIIREAFSQIDPLGLLWSVGKDSNALLWIVRKAFLGRVPFTVIQLDTGMELDEVYTLRDRLVETWDFDLHIEACPPDTEVDPTLPPASRAAARKTAGLRSVLSHLKFRGILVGIRRDEQATRAKERIFSPRTLDGGWDIRNQPPELWDQYKTEFPEGTHVRIHPLLHWTELDIWRYTKREDIPVVSPYFARSGKRYRSLGEKNITLPVPSTASTIDEIIAELETTQTSERAGRTMDMETEDSFERLRSSGYM